MPTDEELLKLYNPAARHPNPRHVSGLRAVWDAATAAATVEQVRDADEKPMHTDPFSDH